MARLLPTLAPFVIAACTELRLLSAVVPTAISPGFDSGETELILAALAEIELATDGGVTFDPQVAEGVPSGGIYLSEEPLEAWGQASLDGRIILDSEMVSEGASSLHWRYVAAHEVLHALGVPHLPTGVMVATPLATYCIDAVALAELCRRVPCGSAAASTCY